MLLIEKFQKMPKRKLVLGLAISTVAVLGVVLLIWAISAGKIKFFAASGSQITNQATATFKDAAGQTFTVQSNVTTTDLTTSIVGDLTGDGYVDILDWDIMKANWTI